MTESLIRILKHLNFKTIWFNFKCFPFKTAIRLPVFLSNNVVIKDCSGIIELPPVFYSGIIRIGFGDVGIFDRKHSKAIWENKGKVVFKGKANLGHGSRICVGENGALFLGKMFTITAESSIVCFHRISIGDACLLSWEILIMDTDFHKVYKDQQHINNNQAVEIGDKVWIGTRCTILKGTKISSGSIVAAGALVTGSFLKEHVLMGGTPAKIINENIDWSY